MTVTVVALVSVNEDEPFALGEYFRITGPLLERAGAEIVKRFTVNEVVVGHRPAKTVMIVKYPDRAAVESVFGSPEYQSVKKIRDQAFSEYHVSIASDEDSEAEEVAAIDTA
ncbi:DUF1330 domain-containing protein [Cognatishimia sp. D5M38]|uniref:DUF1330 domain-containing protein n=2 Tax=Cognatishimia TaxID=2211635 RepID=A0A975I7H1_9RHOB|nr:DUF1330 domain-containing protein [Cognatishimia activa]QTN34826.1 DUF1330 domain-containing protein [Cognatishimia activa]